MSAQTEAPRPAARGRACRLQSAAGGARRNEPVTIGVPLPQGWCRRDEELSLRSDDGTPIPLQTRVLETWSDGSTRWVLLDFQATRAAGARCEYDVVAGTAGEGQPRSARAVRLQPRGDHAVVETGVAQFIVGPAGDLRVSGATVGAEVGATLRITADGDRPLTLGVGEVAVEEAGPLRVVLLVTATAGAGQADALAVAIRYHFYAGMASVRVQATVRNPRRAEHAGGFWDLGDPASCLLRDVSFVVALPGDGAVRTFCSVERDAGIREYVAPFALYQESSGGDAWRSANHVNRQGVVPMREQGYRLRAEVEERGLRATPIVRARRAAVDVAVAHRYFWERFPKAIEVSERELRLGLLPVEFPDVHELQGGEQITEDFTVAFGADPVSDVDLDWVRTPVAPAAAPEWYCGAAAMPQLLPLREDPNPEYVALVNAAVAGADSFAAKRERIDEYGWRHFGELYADHETVFHQGPERFISHYNNQYDAAAGLAVHFFRSGDRRAWLLFDELVRHVIDIDIYHTDADRPAYNHGLFWHTAHHTQADRATHRTYPRSGQASGGPSAEHNYNTGLTLYYFMTGDPRAREAAINPGRWVVAMDDGAQTSLRWLSGAPTGYASATGSFDYHGPGRGPGNGIVSLLNAWRLTHEHAFMAKAEELIRRCVHPAQDLAALDLLDTERRWYYTVFLQAIGRYLDVKIERGEHDATYAYARASLLHYARWMADHEYPYLERPDRLQYPNETWAAQDMRKCEVFRYAAKHGADADRERFLERAAFFFGYSVKTLTAMPTSRFTRPRVLMLTTGYMYAAPPTVAPAAERSAVDPDFGPPTRFVPQRRAALERVVVLGGAAAAIGTALLWSLLAS